VDNRRVIGVPDVFVGECSLGRGLFVARKFITGEVIMELSGPLIGFRDTVAKGEYEGYPLQIGMDVYFDLGPPAHFLNHSCAPNAAISAENNLIALEQINSGDEIRFDYSTTMHENHWTMVCRCGVPSCRGLVEDFIRLPHEVQHRYLRLGVVQPFIVRLLENLSQPNAS
jgi:uncharacterized protein